MASDLAVLPDAELLARYRTVRGADAFAEIVQRHGGMVYRTCLRLVGNAQDAEDATQAVFLVLARRCQAVRDSLGGWLHKVAHDTASKLLRGRTRQERRDKAAAMMRAHLSPSPNTDIREEVDAALTRLPAHLREAVVLRYLEGWDQEEAALMAGCPRGTLSWRTTEGLNRLRTILAGRGTVVAPTALAGFLAQEASASVPANLPAAVQQAVLHGNASAQVVQLAQGVSNTMALAKAKPWLAALAGLAAVAVPLTMYMNRPAEPQLRATLLGHTETPLAARFSPDGTQLATAGSDCTVRVWDVAARKEIFQQRISHWIHDVQFSPDGKRIATCNGFQSVHVWDLAGGATQGFDVRRDHLHETAHCYRLAFAPDGKTLSGAVTYTNYRDKRHLEVQTWDAATLKPVQRRSWDRCCVPQHLHAAADGTLLLLAAQERGADQSFGVLRERWNVAAGKPLQLPSLSAAPAIEAAYPLAMSSSGAMLVTQHRDRLRLWKATGDAVLLPDNAPSTLPVFSSDDRWLAMVTAADGVKVFDVHSGAERLTLPRQGRPGVSVVRFAPDQRQLAVTCHGGTVELWDLPLR